MVHRKDENQREIIRMFMRMCYEIEDLSKVANGVPDLLISKYGINAFVEIKNPKQSPSARKLTYMQEIWHAKWRGLKYIIETIDDCLIIERDFLKIKLLLGDFKSHNFRPIKTLREHDLNVYPPNYEPGDLPIDLSRNIFFGDARGNRTPHLPPSY